MGGKVKLLLFFLLVSGVVIFAAVENNYPSEVSVQPLKIIYDTFNGATTDFDSYNQNDLGDISGVVLEKTAYGKVVFENNLDLITMAGSDWIVNFDEDFTINSNALFVDNSNLSGINKKAVVSLYGITYTDPEIYHNGAICTDCSEVGYSSGTYSFRVTSLSGLYYLREKAVAPYCGDGTCNNGETSDTCSADCGAPDTGGGGGGGGTVPPTNETEKPYNPNYDFKLTPELVEAEIRKGSYFRKQILVENNGTNELTLGVYVTNLTDFIFPDVRSLTIQPGEIKRVNLDIYVSQGVNPDLYLGKVMFTSTHVDHFANVILNIQDSYVLFDIKTEVLKKYVNPGGRVRANVSLINMGDLRNFDVNLIYKIIDFDRNEYTLKEEQFAINRTYNKVFYLDAPADIPIGDYIFYTTVKYQDVNATSYDTFTIEKLSFVSWIILILVILVLMYLAYRWYKKRREELIYGTITKDKKEKEKPKVSEELGVRNVRVPDIS